MDTTAATQASNGFMTLSTITASVEWIPETYLWTLIFGFIVAFILAFAVGANDVANSFGTTVGAKTLSLKTACILASIFETLGAVLLGAKVGETIRKGIIDVSIYNVTEDGRELLMIGEVSAMSGAAIWQLIATALGLPVSGTHSIVGACIGFSLVAVGSVGVNWAKLGFIIASWFISPILSGIMAVSLYVFIKKVILDKKNPLRNGLRCLPFFYAFTFGINCFSIFYIGAPLLGLDIPDWGILLATVLLMLLVGILVQFAVVPQLRRKSKKELQSTIQSPLPDTSSLISSPNSAKHWNETPLNDSGYQTPSNNRKQKVSLSNRSDENYDAEESFIIQQEISRPDEKDLYNSPPEEKDTDTKKMSDSSSYDGDYDDSVLNDSVDSQNNELKKYDEEKGEASFETEDEDPVAVKQLFSSLQILTACFGSFAHGGNDVSNAIGPLIALWLIYHSGEVVQSAATPWYLLLYGGAGIVAGLWILGRRVIKTIGSDLTKITPSRGFCIELMTALTVLLASNVGIPVSTTHCKVGSVVSIGWFRSRSAVTWSTVRNIAVAWFVTVPVSGLISAGVMYLLLFIAR